MVFYEQLLSADHLHRIQHIPEALRSVGYTVFLHVLTHIDTNHILIHHQTALAARVFASSVLPTPVGPRKGTNLSVCSDL